MMRTEKLTMLALGVLSVSGLAACGTQDNTDPAPSAGDESAGSVDLDLDLANGNTINSASYAITGPGGFARTGTINVSQSTRISAQIGGIPAGTGYSITVSATSVEGTDTCGGSATFSVQAGQTASVNVPITCREAAATGSVLVNGTLNLCPVVDGIGANPAEVHVGGTIALSALAHDSDAGPSPLSYVWTASDGTLGSTSTKNTTLTCDEAGTVTVGVTVSDGDPAASCAATKTAVVTCSDRPPTPGSYVAGDFHNHTTCSDGSTSMQRLVHKSTDMTAENPWGLDWFVQAGHGGSGNRNCTLVEDETLATPAYPFIMGQSATTTWVNSGVTVKGNVSGSGANRNMWRWQSLQEFQYPLLEYLNAYLDRPLFLGVESVVAGHEHTSMSVITGQMPAAIDTTPLPTTPGYLPLGSGTALAMWEYCFDRGDSDTSRGDTNQWDCSVPGSPNAADPSWNATGMKLVPAGGTGTGDRGHNKTLEALKWMAEFHPEQSYYAPAHLERAGPFNPNGNNGFNVEHLRNFNNLAPRIAFGFESQPGHGASENRGEYRPLRQNINGVPTDSVGGTTYGGTGVYAGQIGGVWDALLGEGRRWWFFASSDWHSRGTFGPDDRRSNNDFWPGEYQRNYALVRNAGPKQTPQEIVDGLRSGNNFAPSGQIIDRLGFLVCSGKAPGIVAELAANAAIANRSPDADGCATMGEKLTVASGTDLVVGVAVRDPAGASFSPYTFPNPSLLQVGINQPMNMPVLDHIDLIGGLVTGYRTPGTPEYSGAWPANTAWLHTDGTTEPLSAAPVAARNDSAAVTRTFSGSGMGAWETVVSHIDGSEFLVMTFSIPAVSASQYVRLRGTNMPPAVPFETDASGNPLSDLYTNSGDRSKLSIPCTTAHSPSSQFDGCPDHLVTATGTSPITGQVAVSVDVAAWADLWFYSNPVYIQVNGSFPVAGLP